MSNNPINYPASGEAPVISPSDWASWINELPQMVAGTAEPQPAPVIPPIIEEAHQPAAPNPAMQNVITAQTLREQQQPHPPNAKRASIALQPAEDDFDLPIVPEIEEHYDSLTKATSGPRHLERALYGQVNPLLVAEVVFGIADEATLASAYGMTSTELRRVVESKPFLTAAESLKKAWGDNPQLDTQFRAKQSFDYLLPILTAQAADPKAHPGLKKGLVELLAKVANVMPKETINAGGGGNSFAIQIILNQPESKDDDFRIIDGSDV